jgi:tungstate transport system substrate-binding protein
MTNFLRRPASGNKQTSRRLPSRFRHRAKALAKVFGGVVLGLSVATLAQAAEQMKMAVTTSFNNSGLAEVLLPQIADDLDLEVQLLVVGTGQALRLGQAGDVDAVLVHSRASEEAFVDGGYGTHRREIMYNDFVLIGPGSDPAGIAPTDSAAQALAAIAQSQAVFVSRGDDSGTHKKELSLWTAAGQDPETFGGWYRATGSGMGAALNTAAGMDAYILADRASWLNFANKGDLAILFAGDPVLFNQYAYLPVNPELHPHVRNDLAQQLETWLTSDRARALIDGYTINGETLFTFNAEAQ